MPSFKSTRPKVDVLILTYRGLNPKSFPEIQNMLNYSVERGVDIKVPPVRATALVHMSRNNALTQVREDADFVLFIDDDMLPPRTALLDLLQHDLPVVAAYMTTREEIPVKIAGMEYDPKSDAFLQLTRLKPNSLIRPRAGSQLCAGTAFLLVKKAVYDQALVFHLEGRDWLADNRISFDRMGVSEESREVERGIISQLRHDLFEKTGTHRTFHYSVNDAQQELGEDISFSRMLHRMGVEVCIDSGTIVGHMGFFPYSPANLNDSAPEAMSLGDDSPSRVITLAEPTVN